MDVPDEDMPPTPDDDLLALVAAVLSRAQDREAAAVVSDGDERYEVAVAPGDRWVVQASSTEWIGTGDSVVSYETQLAAGARQRTEEFPPGWYHPALALLWPHLLPVWGRLGDEYRPARIIDGLNGPAGIVCEALDAPVVGGESLGPWAHVLLNDDLRITLVELEQRTWTLLDIHE
ncbi:hypothetical protein GA0111570_106106 [Raineyella antarctica]|uniref:Uncharacterized protein n=1 Tax=Raineyella antarctica TaxID=1577474 RepID=A0A1G6H3A3_9ACTN|nr:hypothetical protein [Raineyella antarctica]SDB88633.1 hypothetical protein GA0111570_106106 [Raineyella antarctica]